MDEKTPVVSDPAPPATVAAGEDTSSSDESNSNVFTITQVLFDSLTARGFSANAIRNSIASGCIDESTCTRWITMHEGNPNLDAPLPDGVEVVVKAKRVLTEAERSAKVKELQERIQQKKEEEKAESHRKELERIERGRKALQMKEEMDVVRRQLDLEEVRREKAADLAARRRIKIQIAADRLVRQGHSKEEATEMASNQYEMDMAKARAEAAEKVHRLGDALPSSSGAPSAGAWDLSSVTASLQQTDELRVSRIFESDVDTADPVKLVEEIQKEADEAKVQECVRLLQLIIDNIIGDPFEMKKRTLRLSTKLFRDAVLPNDAALQLLRWCGFDLSIDKEGNQAICLTCVVTRKLAKVRTLLS